MKKLLLIAIIIIAITGGTVFWLNKGSNPDAGAPADQAHGGPMGGGMPAPEVTVVTVTPQEVTFSKDLPGRTSAFRVAEIRPQVSGIVVKRLFDEGSDVTNKQQLYQIDVAPYKAAYDSAQADLQKAKANVESVKAKEARFAELVKIGGVSKQEYDDIKAGLAQSNADVAIATAAVATAKINLDYTKVFSPIAGRIGQSLVTEGALVTANQASPLATVQQFDKIYVDVTQSSGELMNLRQQFSRLEEGAEKPTAQLVIDGKVYGEEGVLQFSDVSVNQSTGTVQLRILFENTNHEILPGLFVHARIAQSKDNQAILVSQKAVARNPDGSTIVMVVDAENKVAIKPIQISDAVGDQWRVLSGLNAGDRVIVEGIMKVQPGMQVVAVEHGQAAQGQDPAAAPAEQTPVEQAPAVEEAPVVEETMPEAVTEETPATEAPTQLHEEAPAREVIEVAPATEEVPSAE